MSPRPPISAPKAVHAFSAPKAVHACSAPKAVIAVLAFLAVLWLSMVGQSSLEAQSIGAADPRTVGRNYQNLDQIYAVAPQIIAGRHPMTQAQAAMIRQTQNRQGVVPPQNLSRVIDNSGSPIIEPIDTLNLIWIGTTTAAALVATATYLITRQQ